MSLRARRKRFFRHMSRRLHAFGRKMSRALRSLSLKGRIIIGSAGAVVIVGVVLAVALSGNQAGTALASDTLAGGASDNFYEMGVRKAAPDLDQILDVLPIATPTPMPTATPAPVPTATPKPDPTLEYGMENERVTQLQTRLMDLGYLDIDEPTQYYGPATKYAVELFQRQHSLEQDGIAGPITLDAINSGEAKKYTLLEGTSGRDVDALQRQLKDMGYLNKATGYYGTETIEAVKDFQKRNGLSVDGKTGEQTLALLYSPNAKASATKAATEKRRANITTMINIAADQLGKKYILGAQGPNTFDCSGLVYYCLKKAGSSRGRYNAAGYSQVSDWEKIKSMGDLQKGDLVFFYNNSKSKVGHVGIYIGGGMMIDASSANGKVVKRSCTTSYWKSHFVCGRRPW